MPLVVAPSTTRSRYCYPPPHAPPLPFPPLRSTPLRSPPDRPTANCRHLCVSRRQRPRRPQVRTHSTRHAAHHHTRTRPCTAPAGLGGNPNHRARRRWRRVHAASSGGSMKTGSAVAHVSMRACPHGAAATSPVRAPSHAKLTAATSPVRAPSRMGSSAIRSARATHTRAAVAEGTAEEPPTGAFHMHFGAGRLGMGLVFPAMRCVAQATALESGLGVCAHARREGVGEYQVQQSVEASGVWWRPYHAARKPCMRADQEPGLGMYRAARVAAALTTARGGRRVQCERGTICCDAAAVRGVPAHADGAT